MEEEMRLIQAIRLIAKLRSAINSGEKLDGQLSKECAQVIIGLDEIGKELTL